MMDVANVRLKKDFLVQVSPQFVHLYVQTDCQKEQKHVMTITLLLMTDAQTPAKLNLATFVINLPQFAKNAQMASLKGLKNVMTQI